MNVGAGSRAGSGDYIQRKSTAEIQFGQHGNLDSFKKAVETLSYIQQRTTIDKALTMAAKLLMMMMMMMIIFL